MIRLKKTLQKIIPTELFILLQKIYHWKLALIGAVIYGFPSKKLFVVAVTGTKGKTSTVEFVNNILEEAGYTTAVAGTLRFKIGNDSKQNLFKMTMPGRFHLQKFLRKAVRSGCTHAIIEMTSEGAKQYRHKFIYLDALIVTNVTPEHIESHGSYENYVLAKLSIAQELSKSPKQKKYIIVNTDSKEAEKFLSVPNVEKITYSLADAKNIEEKDSGVSFTWQQEDIKSHFPGKFNIYNMLGAATFAHRVLAVSPQIIAHAFSNFSGIRGRMERVAIITDSGDIFPSFSIIVDYAHTEDSMRKAYEAMPAHPKVCVFGCTGGGRDKWKRPLMGGVATEFCRKIILTDDDSYDEDLGEIINDIKRGIETANKDKARNGEPTVPVEVITDRRKAIATALAEAHKEDIVFITGKGTDPYLMGPRGSKIKWDDAQIVREELFDLLEKRGAHFTPIEKTTPPKQRGH